VVCAGEFLRDARYQEAAAYADLFRCGLTRL